MHVSLGSRLLILYNSCKLSDSLVSIKKVNPSTGVSSFTQKGAAGQERKVSVTSAHPASRGACKVCTCWQYEAQPSRQGKGVGGEDSSPQAPTMLLCSVATAPPAESVEPFRIRCSQGAFPEKWRFLGGA